MPSSDFLNRFYVDPAKVPLRWLLVIPFVLLTVGSTALVGYLSYRSGQQAVENLADQLLQQTSERVRDRLSSYLHTPQQIVAANRLAAEQGTLNQNNQEQLQRQLWQQMVLNPSVPANGFWDGQGNGISYGRVLSKEEEALSRKVTGRTLPIGTLYVSENAPNQRQFYLLDSQGTPQELIYTFKPTPHNLDWYDQAKAIPQQHWTPVYINQVAPVLQLTAVAPVYDTAGKFQGLFSSNYLLPELSTFLNTLHFSPTGQVFIVDRSGNLIATSVSSEASAMRQVDGKPEQLPAVDSQNDRTREVAKQLFQQFGDFGNFKDTQHLSLMVHQQRQFVQVIPYQDQYGLDWLVVAIIPGSDFMAEIDAQNARTVWLCFGTLVGTIALGLLVSKRITDPLHRLNRSAHAIAQNQFDQGVPVTGVGEVKQLSQSFQQMAEQLRLSFQLRTNYEKELEQQVIERTAELAQARDLREAIFNESTDAIFLVEPSLHQQILDCNQRAVDLFEVDSKAALIGIQGTTLQKQPYTEEEIAEIAAELEQKGFWNREIEYVTQTGKCFWGNLAAKPITVAGQAMQLVRLTDITDRKQTEKALRQSEARLQQLTTRVPGVLYTIVSPPNDSPYFEYVSAAVEEIHELPQAQVYADFALIYSQFHPEDVADYNAIANYCVANLLPFIHEWRIITPAGKLKWLHAEALLERRDNGDVVSHGIVQDITDRKQIELALKAKTEELDRFFSVALDLLCIADTDGYFRRLNQQWEEMLGYSLQELEGSRFLDFVHPDDLDSTLHEISILAEQKISLNFVNRYRCRDGSYRWLEWRSFPVGNLIYAAARDITDRRQAEIALRQSEQKFRGAFDTISAGMALVSPAGGFIEVNDALCEMLGYSEAELLNLKLEDIEYPDDRPTHTHWIEPVFSGELSSYQDEMRFLTKHGQVVWGLMNLAVMRDATTNPLFLIVQIANISDRHKLDAMKDEFVSVVSHELRTPLTSIRGSLGILETGVLKDNPETAQRMLQVALKNTNRLVRLLNDILDLQRLESGKAPLVLETCEVSDLMEQAVESVQAIANQATVTLNWTPLFASVKAAPDAIVQTLTNLLSNAIKFSPPEGTVWLKAEGVGEQESKWESKRDVPSSSHANTPTPYILFSIADQGRGIPSDKLESIFGRFQQVDSSDSRQKGGTGLGLAICKSIVQQHQGQIWVESTLEQGSTFYFTLPVVM